MSKKPTKTKDKAIDTPFEQAVDAIQQIVDDVESGEVPLGESLERYEQGMKLLRHCRGILDAAEAKIKTLTLDELDAEPTDDDA